jgi:hypothetical protein
VLHGDPSVSHVLHPALYIFIAAGVSLRWEGDEEELRLSQHANLTGDSGAWGVRKEAVHGLVLRVRRAIGRWRLWLVQLWSKWRRFGGYW